MSTGPSIEYFVPQRAYISSITSTGSTTTVTTVDPNNYLDGLFVRLVFPAYCGMTSLINKTFLITVIDASTFSIPVDTSFDDVFVIPIWETQPAEVIPVGEEANTLLSAVRNTGTEIPEYSWTNTTFPWINRP